MRIYIDAETIPSQIMGAREAARSGVKPPANYKKPETIAAWWEEEGQAAAERAYRAQALDAAQGELVAISWATDDTEPATAIRGPGEDERLVLARFFAGIQTLVEDAAVPGPDGQSIWQPDPYFIGHHIGGFDLPFIWRRSIILGIRPPRRRVKGRTTGTPCACGQATGTPSAWTACAMPWASRAPRPKAWTGAKCLTPGWLATWTGLPSTTSVTCWQCARYGTG